MNTQCVTVAVIVLTSAPSLAEDSVFAELEEVYLTVLADSVSVDGASNRAYAIAMRRYRRGFGTKYTPLPEAMWAKLAARLKAKGIDVSQFVSPTDIGWKDGNRRSLIHKPTGKDAWVYSISDVAWHGGTQLIVSQSVFHGGLEAYGCTVTLEKKDGKWVIVERTDRWIS